MVDGPKGVFRDTQPCFHSCKAYALTVFKHARKQVPLTIRKAREKQEEEWTRACRAKVDTGFPTRR